MSPRISEITVVDNNGCKSIKGDSSTKTNISWDKYYAMMSLI